jgi:superfamily II DNA or RNA helicase
VDSVTKLKNHSYNCVIIDEFHHSGAKTYRKLNDKFWNHIYYRLGVTATPFRSQEEETILLESVLAEVIYKITYEQAVEKGYIVPVDAYYIDVPTTQSAKNLPNNWKAVYNALVVNNEPRNNQIHELLLKLHAHKLSTLCLVKEIAHGEILGANGAFPFVNGQNDERHLIEGFSQGKIKTLIGTTGIIGEGIDTKPCEYVILAGLGKSKNAIMQQVGRGVRKFGDKESCKVIIFNDRSHVWTRRHYQEQVKILKEEYGVIPARLEL